MKSQCQKLVRIYSVKKNEKKYIALKASSSKVTSFVQEDNDSNEDSLSVEEMGIFVRLYNLYVQ